MSQLCIGSSWFDTTMSCTGDGIFALMPLKLLLAFACFCMVRLFIGSLVGTFALDLPLGAVLLLMITGPFN